MVLAIWFSIPFFFSLPLWLPAFIARLRNAIFVRINGHGGLSIPSANFGKKAFRLLYAHPHSGGRSKGAKLSDLFWYWLAPGPEYHQEHIENGPVYDEVASCTNKILAVPKREIEKEIHRSFQTIFGSKKSKSKIIRLRDYLMPMYADFYYKLIFQEDCPKHARNLIVGNAKDVADALKHTKMRNMKKRLALTDFLQSKIDSGAIAHELPKCFDSRQQAFYLQGVYFNSAIVQMSEATSHLLLSLAENPKIQQRVFHNLDNPSFLVHVLYESFRLYPLFGIAHRIVQNDIKVSRTKIIRKGTVLCFDYKKFHNEGEKDDSVFDPDRWKNDKRLSQRAFPFGVPGNRPCPAKSIAMISLMEVLKIWSKEYQWITCAEHQRNLANRGPCLLMPRNSPNAKVSRYLSISFIFLVDQLEKVTRSLAQLVFGTLMVWDASRKKLCTNYFEHNSHQELETRLEGRLRHVQ